MEKTFRARSSLGWLWLSGIGLITLVLLVVPVLLSIQELPIGVLFLTLGIALVTGIPFIYIAIFIRKIRYTLAQDHLIISMGWMINHKIPYDSIQSVVKKNLSISLWSSMRLPGLALFNVLYTDEGIVRMCATAAATDIVLIKTDTKKFGITPADEPLFLKSLLAKIK